jgi:hypothetical protein
VGSPQPRGHNTKTGKQKADCATSISDTPPRHPAARVRTSDLQMTIEALLTTEHDGHYEVEEHEERR